jgi:hypothetical protein
MIHALAVILILLSAATSAAILIVAAWDADIASRKSGNAIMKSKGPWQSVSRFPKRNLNGR